MPDVTVTNLTLSNVDLGPYFGPLGPRETRVKYLTVNELELTRVELLGQEAAGSITWTSSPTMNPIAAPYEFPTVEDLGQPEVVAYPLTAQFKTLHLWPSNQNNYDAVGTIDKINHVRCGPGFLDRTCSGLAGGFAGRRFYFTNIRNFLNRRISLLHESLLSLPENRFLVPNGSNLTIPSNSTACLWYDGEVSRWRVLTLAY